MKSKIIVSAILAMIILTVGIAPAFADTPVQSIVNASPSLNVRSGPGTTYPVVGSLANGSACSVHLSNKTNGFVQLATPSYYLGYWVASQYLIKAA